MATSPLTHHEILGLIEPFTRSGRRLDMAGSDRVKRCLVFKPETCLKLSANAPALSDSLELDCPSETRFVLRRAVVHPAGLQATLQTEGADVDSLLAGLQAVDPEPLFRSGDGWCMACNHRLVLPTNTLQLSSAEVQVQGLRLRLKMPAVKGYPAELELTANAAIDLPDDLLQVLGRHWARLTRHPKNWRSSLRLPGPDSERSRLAVNQLELAARHVAQTLAHPPSLFHQQQAGARWRVAARRAVPLLILLALVLGSLAVPYLGIAQNSVYWMLIFNAPPLLLLWGFCLREMPSFELPRPPRRLTAASWWATPPVDTRGSSPHPTTSATSVPNGAP